MDYISLVIVIILLLCAVVYFAFLFLLSLIDDITIAFLNRPLYVHFYLNPKKISSIQRSILMQNMPFYAKLNAKQRTYFNHRLVKFIDRYQFIPRENLVITDEMKTIIAATYVMLTLGMRRYLVSVFDKIIIYPDEYYSEINTQNHKGEFNPRLKAVVFSWKHFIEGQEISDDNLNLGIHEFTHVIHHYSLRSQDSGALNFKKQYEKLLKEVFHLPNKERLINSNYFRIYAFTNQFEFISVIIEHYFETPDQFATEFPELFENVGRMLNLRQQKLRA